jgi:prepilin-type N-terminal cleavage/methylation domain-containing protein
LGFSLIEVLVALAIFVVSVTGVIAMESRSFETQAAAKHLREAERLADRFLSEAMAAGFSDLVTRSALGAPGSLPHDDILGEFPFSEVPVDVGVDEVAPGVKPGFYRVGRRVSQVMFSTSVAAGNNPDLVDAVLVEVYVLWIDSSNSASPPPADVEVSDLVLGNITPGDANFQPWVAGVQLRAVRLNDG